MALAGQWELPGDLQVRWDLRGCAPAPVRPAEHAHAARLARS